MFLNKMMHIYSVQRIKLKRHFLIHTRERDFVCTYEGCGKALFLDFNLRSHMETLSQENYHICPYSGCGKRYAHEYKLKNHVAAYHEKEDSSDFIILGKMALERQLDIRHQ